MNIEVVKQIHKKYKFYSFLIYLKKEVNSFLYQARALIDLTKLKKREKTNMSFLYGDHMVLQCEEIISIKGEAMPGEWITVCIADQKKEACTQSDGRWEVELQPLLVGGPYTLEIITRKKKLVYKDVYAGEVWLCSGQSNMIVKIARYLRNNKFENGDVFDSKHNPPFRSFCMNPVWPTYTGKWNRIANYCINNYQNLRTEGWSDCVPERINSLSAIAYFYGKALSEQLQRPIGLIINPVGGTAEYCWIERQWLQKECPEILTDWYKNQKVTTWMKERAILNLGKQYSEHEQLHPYHPGYCFETFIRPIKDYTIKGVAWFSGESSAHSDDMELFEKLQELQIRNWREAWGKCIPFYYIQLPGINYEKEFGKGIHYYYPEIRSSQCRLLKKIPCSGMAVSCDQLLFRHSIDQRLLGRRLARLALHNTYGNKDIMPCGPLFHEALLRENLIYIRFDWSDDLCTKDGDDPKTFEVAGKDRHFYPARAWIERNEVVLSCSEVTDPYWIHYAFSEFPIEANLVNGAGLPAACFEEQINLINI